MAQSIETYGKASFDILMQTLAPSEDKRELALMLGYIEHPGNPAALAPAFIGQRLLDTVNNAMYVAVSTEVGGYEAQVTAQTDAVSGEVDAIKASNETLIRFKQSAVNFYRMAVYGDSRANSGTHRTVASGSGGLSGDKVPTCLAALRGDINIVFSGGISGDTAANWNSAARVASKQTVSDLLQAKPDFCYIQYGVNDVIAGTSASTIVGYLKLLIDKILGAGVAVVMESINTCAQGAATYINGWSSAGGFGASYDAKLAVLQDVNAQMQSWLATFPSNNAIFVDTTSVTAAIDGFAKTDGTYGDGTHVSSIGARACAQLVNDAISAYWPIRRGQRIRSLYPNSVNRSFLSPSAGRASGFNAIANESGTATSTYSIATDSDGDLCQQYDVTVSALSSGISVQRFDILSDYDGGSPFLGLVAGDAVQASAQVYLDDGAGGAPIAFACHLRERMYYDGTYNTRTSVYSTCGDITASGSSTDHPRMAAPYSAKLMTGGAVLDTDSSHLTASCSLQVYVCCNMLGTYRLRVKNPQLCLVNAGIRSVTAPATTVPYINATESPLQVFIAGGTITVIAINGVATGLTAGGFVLSPGDTITMTYSVAPTTFSVLPINNKGSS